MPNKKRSTKKGSVAARKTSRRGGSSGSRSKSSGGKKNSEEHHGTGESKTTTDHEEIQRWIEERDGRPSQVRGTGGLLRIDFGPQEDNLEPIDWESFFKIFDENDLAFLYQETIDGKESRFFKFVNRSSSGAKSKE